VLELLSAQRRGVRRLWVADDQDPAPQLDEIERLAASAKVRVEIVPRGRLDRAARTETSQGVVAWAPPLVPVSLEDLAGAGRGVPFLLVVAGVTDPHNLGALLRSAECAGATGVVLPRHRTARLTPTVAKVAAGAIEHLPFCVVPGIPAALARLSGLGIWSIGLAHDARRSVFDLGTADAPVALVVGNEERGLAPLVRRRCDEVVAIPQRGSIDSLNVAAAGAVASFEVARRRGATAGGAETAHR
jgi:23S rRNA (guanosine2251-2'-O)-methyltransferase